MDENIDLYPDQHALAIGRLMVELKLLEKEVESLRGKLDVVLTIITVSFFVLFTIAVYVIDIF